MFRKNFFILFLFIIFLSMIIALDAYAHKLKILALTEANEIYGYVYFPGGGRGKGVPVILHDASGKVIQELTTNGKGHLRFSKTGTPPYKIIADTQDGHMAEYVIRQIITPESAVIQTQHKGKDIAYGKQSSEDLMRIIDKTVSQQIAPLRIQLEAYEEKIRIRDIIGAIGYIFGIFGLFFFLRSGSRNK